METTFDYLRAHAAELGARILETYPPLQSTKDSVAPAVATLLRKALPAQGLAITGTAKYLRQAKAARIVAECGAGKTFMALGTIYVLTAGQPSATLVMCPSHSGMKTLTTVERRLQNGGISYLGWTYLALRFRTPWTQRACQEETTDSV
jgi:hypothetical protein